MWKRFLIIQKIASPCKKDARNAILSYLERRTGNTNFNQLGTVGVYINIFYKIGILPKERVDGRYERRWKIFDKIKNRS